MKPRMKAFGVALFAAFALSAMAASAASAVTDHITAESEPATLTAKSISANGQFFRPTTEGRDYVECKAVSVTGTVVKTQSEVTVEPSYSECEAEREGVKVKATVTTNKCHFLFTGVTTTGNLTGGEHASVHIKGCENATAGISVDVTALKLKCIDVPEQEVADAVRYEDDPANPGKSIVIKATAHSLKSDTTNTTACPTKSGGTETHETGTYVGEVTVSAHNSLEEPVGLSVTHT